MILNVFMPSASMLVFLWLVSFTLLWACGLGSAGFKDFLKNLKEDAAAVVIVAMTILFTIIYLII